MNDNSMNEGNVVTCKCVGVYSKALTYGKKYVVIEQDLNKNQTRIKGDNNRIRWYPNYCFDLSGEDIPTIKSIWIADEHYIDPPQNDLTDVLVRLSNDTSWVGTFVTFTYIRSFFEKSRVPEENLSGKYFWVSDMILVDEISRERIEELLHYFMINCDFEQMFDQFEDEEE